MEGTAAAETPVREGIKLSSGMAYNHLAGMQGSV